MFVIARGGLFFEVHIDTSEAAGLHERIITWKMSAELLTSSLSIETGISRVKSVNVPKIKWLCDVERATCRLARGWAGSEIEARRSCGEGTIVQKA